MLHLAGYHICFWCFWHARYDALRNRTLLVFNDAASMTLYSIASHDGGATWDTPAAPLTDNATGIPMPGVGGPGNSVVALPDGAIVAAVYVDYLLDYHDRRVNRLYAVNLHSMRTWLTTIDCFRKRVPPPCSVGSRESLCRPIGTTRIAPTPTAQCRFQTRVSFGVQTPARRGRRCTYFRTWESQVSPCCRLMSRVLVRLVTRTCVPLSIHICLTCLPTTCWREWVCKW